MSKEQLAKAQQLYQAGKLQEALAIYQDFFESHNNNADIAHIIGVIHAQLENYSDAANFITAAIDINAKECSFYNSLGNVYLRQNNFADASTAFKKALQLNPRYAVAYNGLANCLINTDKLIAAEKAYNKAIDANPNYAEAYYNYALLLIKQNNIEKSIKQLKKCIEINAHHPRAQGQLGELYLNTGEFIKAITHLDNRLAMEPEHAETIHSLGVAFYGNSDYDNAIIAFEKVLTLNPKHNECYHNLANTYLKKGDTGKALNYYMRQQELMPLFESFYNIGVLLMYQERNKDAAQYFKEGLKLKPDDLSSYLNLGTIFIKLQDYDQATQYYQAAQTLKPNDTEIQHIISAISKEDTPAEAPAEYTQHLFDQYAPHYDQHLTKYLHYNVPEQIKEALFEETGITKPTWKILDLGCGTGLAGEALRATATELIGIDLSPEMITVATNKAVYDTLKITDVNSALKEYLNCDIIVAADVFTYIGDLSEIFKLAHRNLTDEGLFAFSVEKGTCESYELQQTIRYAHSKYYLETLIKSNKFTTLRFDNIVLRQQKKKPVEGYLIILRK